MVEVAQWLRTLTRVREVVGSIPKFFVRERRFSIGCSLLSQKIKEPKLCCSRHLSAKIEKPEYFFSSETFTINT